MESAKYVISDTRIGLRPWTSSDSDVQALYDGASHVEVSERCSFPRHTSLEHSRHVIENLFVGKQVYAVVDISSDTPIGCIDLHTPNVQVSAVLDYVYQALNLGILSPKLLVEIAKLSEQSMLQRCSSDTRSTIEQSEICKLQWSSASSIAEILHDVWSHKDNVYEFGYWINRRYWGQGYATQALNLLMSYAFSDLHVFALFGVHDADNPASGKVQSRNYCKEIARYQSTLFTMPQRTSVLHYCTHSTWKMAKLMHGSSGKNFWGSEAHSRKLPQC